MKYDLYYQFKGSARHGPGGASPSAHACHFTPFPPDALFLQRVGDLARHVALIVLGENTVGVKEFVLTKRSLGDDPLSFPEKVGQKPRIGHHDILFFIGDGKADRPVALVDKRALFHEPADAQTLPGARRFLRELARPIEKDDIVAQRQKDES